MITVGSIHREQLVLHAKRGLTPGLDLVRFGESEADLAEFCEWRGHVNGECRMQKRD
jgi:hypothetical protein